MILHLIRSLILAIALSVFFGDLAYAQQPYEPRYSDPLEDRWRWQRLEDLGSHNRRIVVHPSGQAVIQKKDGDDRIILYD